MCSFDLFLVFLPVRIGANWLHRRLTPGGTAKGSLRVATALTPTLVFTLVLATILRERFQVADALYGALLIYAGISTLLPSLMLAKPVDFTVLVGPLPQESPVGTGAHRPAPATTPAQDATTTANVAASAGDVRPSTG